MSLLNNAGREARHVQFAISSYQTKEKLHAAQQKGDVGINSCLWLVRLAVPAEFHIWGETMEINKVELWQSAGRLEEAMRSLGIARIRYSTDQKELADAVTLMGKGALGEHFKRSLNTLAPSNFMWIGAEDKDGNVVATIAARLDDTGNWSLKRFLIEHFCRVIDGEDGQPAQVNSDSAAFADNIFGKTVYIGETYCERDWRKLDLRP